MTTYAKIENGIVTQVIVAEPDFIATQEGTWIEDTNSIKNDASLGWTYNSVLGAFISPKPFASWILDENATWQAPVAYPSVTPDGNGTTIKYHWNEETQTWDQDVIPDPNASEPE